MGPVRVPGADRRRALALLGLTSTVGSAGLAAGGSAGALLGARLAGTDAAAGLPLGLLVLGSGASAMLVSRYSARIGRGRSLAAGYAVGAAGAVLVVLAAVAANLAVLLIGSILLGSANAAVFLTRYAAAEAAGEHARGRAVGLVFFATSVGAVAGPLLLGPSGRLAHTLGLPPLTGLYLIAAAAFALAAAALAVGAASAAGRAAGVGPPEHPGQADATAPPTRGELARGLRSAPAGLGLALLATANLVMVAFMAVAPVHLMGHGQALDRIGVVIALHVVGMFAPAPLSGWLADRTRPLAVAAIGCLLILLAGVGGSFIDQDSGRSITLLLAVLGIGWNFSVVGASTLIARSVPARLRVHVEGIGEVAMALAAAAGAPAAGLIIVFGGFTTLSLTATVVTVVALVASARHLHGRSVNAHDIGGRKCTSTTSIIRRG
jgi:MFS family permease